MVERPAVNRLAVGSSPTAGASSYCRIPLYTVYLLRNPEAPRSFPVEGLPREQTPSS